MAVVKAAINCWFERSGNWGLLIPVTWGAEGTPRKEAVAAAAAARLAASI